MKQKRKENMNISVNKKKIKNLPQTTKSMRMNWKKQKAEIKMVVIVETKMNMKENPEANPKLNTKMTMNLNVRMKMNENGNGNECELGHESQNEREGECQEEDEAECDAENGNEMRPISWLPRRQNQSRESGRELLKYPVAMNTGQSALWTPEVPCRNTLVSSRQGPRAAGKRKRYPRNWLSI
jgi:hypothetical protein